MRLGKAGEPNLTEMAVDTFEIGKIRYLKKEKIMVSSLTVLFLIIVLN